MAYLLCEAMMKKKRVRLKYDGHIRIVEVHLVGEETIEQVQHALVWQVSGGSNSGNEEGWKDFHINNISGVEIIDEYSQAPRAGYVQQRSQYTGIVDKIDCEV